MRAPQDGTPRRVGAPRCALQEGRLFEKEMAWSPLKMSLFLPSVFFLNHDGKRQRTQKWLHSNAFSERRTKIIARLWMCTTKIICHTLTVQKHFICQKKPNETKKKIYANVESTTNNAKENVFSDLKNCGFRYRTCMFQLTKIQRKSN